MLHPEKKLPFNVLFLCTGNTARSVLAERLLAHHGGGRFHACSAGSFPKGVVHPLTLKLLAEQGIAADEARSKSWDEFAAPGATAIDFIFTVCASAAGETCPIWPGHPTTAHWGIADPAHIEPLAARQVAFEDAYRELKQRIEAFVALPLESMSTAEIAAAARRIHLESEA